MKYSALLTSAAVILCIGVAYLLSNSNAASRNNVRESQPVESKRWPGQYTQINQGQRTQTYLFEYDGRKYILVINMSGHDMVMVEHKSP